MYVAIFSSRVASLLMTKTDVKLGKMYSRFADCLHDYLTRSTIVSRPTRSDALFLSFKNLFWLVLQYCFYLEQPVSSTHSPSKWAGPSVPLSLTPPNTLQIESPYTSQLRSPRHLAPPSKTPSPPSNTPSPDPLSIAAPLSISIPSSQSSTLDLKDLATCFDALYFLIQTAQDLTQISYDRKSLLRLTKGRNIAKMPRMLTDLIRDLVTVMRQFDPREVARLMEGRGLMVFQLEELAGWKTGQGNRLFGGLEEVVWAMREMKDWRMAKMRRAVWSLRQLFCVGEEHLLQEA